GGRVVAVAAGALLDVVQHHRRLFAAVGDDLAQRGFHRAQRDDDAVVLVFVDAAQRGQVGQRADQRDAAARDHAFFNGRTGSVQGVFDAGLLFLHLDLGRSTDLDHGHAAGELGNALLQLLLVVVRRGLFDLRLDLLDAGLDALGLASAVDDGGVFLGDLDLLGAAEVLNGRLVQGQADFFRHHRAAGQDRHVLEHRLATVAEARRLDGADLDDAADGVDDERGQGLALDFLGDDQQRLAHVGDLLVVQQDERVIQLGRHRLLVVDEVRRQVAAVELHALDDVEFIVQARAFFNGDDAFLADLVHGLGDQLADVLVGVGRDRTDLGDFLGGVAGLGDVLELGDRGDDRLVHAALEVHRVHAGGDGFHAFADDRLGEH